MPTTFDPAALTVQVARRSALGGKQVMASLAEERVLSVPVDRVPAYGMGT